LNRMDTKEVDSLKLEVVDSLKLEVVDNLKLEVDRLVELLGSLVEVAEWSDLWKGLNVDFGLCGICRVMFFCCIHRQEHSRRRRSNSIRLQPKI